MKEVKSHIKHCADKDCFLKNNWFGASPHHPNNVDLYSKCINCTKPKVETSD